jgi:nickel-dependent lactate racemase
LVSGLPHSDLYMSDEGLREVVASAASSGSFDNKRVLVIIPDGTRTMPMAQMYSALKELLKPRTKALDYLVALGTHPPMNDMQLSKLMGHGVVDGSIDDSRIFNHRWEDPDTFTCFGRISASEIASITNGLISQEVPVTLNRMILDYDHIVICGPVFPHEVAGFSGGNKYFFPGIAGSEIINLTHWLGAMITNYNVIGTSYTPVRAVIERAAMFIPRPTSCFALVVTEQGLAGMFFGNTLEAWKAAALLSAKMHIVYVDAPFKRVLAIMPEMYDDLWTAAKGMYKMEPAVADGGEVVIYSPGITEVSYTHGKVIDEVGYHCRDYFTKQWDRFKDYPGGVLAHSTHLKGMGHYDAETCIEYPRMNVTLATGIPQERCQRLNLGYIDPGSIKIEEWRGRENEGVVVIPRAGETLFRLRSPRTIAAN